MKCRQHSSDLSSAVGVCASCLRERLFLLISAQSQSQLHNEFNSDDRRKSDAQPPPIFPRSVSPYVTRRKFDEDSSDRRFHSTPQVGPSIERKKTKKSRFSFITSLFKSRSDKSVSDPFTASTSSPLWCPAGSKSKSVPKFVGAERIQNRVSDRGMSPERLSSNDGEESSSHSSESCEPTWKQTPVSSLAPVKRRRSSTTSGLAFCLSPLVRASPNRNWNRNSLPADLKAAGVETGGGASRMAARLAAANSFGKNRSKKMADLGRGSYDHRR
ncbi:unnamed protein product [Rhodiola kirilowii]